MNDSFYYFSFKAGHSSSSSSHSGHHSGHHGKGKHSKAAQKHKAQHQLKHDIHNLKKMESKHPKTVIPSTESVVAAHNQKIQAQEQNHRNILARRATKGHPVHRPVINLLPADPKNPTAIPKDKYNVSDAQKKSESRSALDHTPHQAGRGDAGDDTLSGYAYAYNTSMDNSLAPIFVGGGFVILMLLLGGFPTIK